MSIHFRCDCGNSLTAKQELAGRRVKCSQCGAVLTVPRPNTGSPTTEGESAINGGRSKPGPAKIAGNDEGEFALRSGPGTSLVRKSRKVFVPVSIGLASLALIL